MKSRMVIQGSDTWALGTAEPGSELQQQEVDQLRQHYVEATDEHPRRLVLGLHLNTDITPEVLDTVTATFIQNGAIGATASAERDESWPDELGGNVFVFIPETLGLADL